MAQNDVGQLKTEAMPEQSAAGRPTWVRYQVLVAACALAIVTYIQRVGFAVAGPELKKSLNLDDQSWSYLTAAFLLAYGAFEIPGGLRGDRFGVRHLLVILVLGWSVMTGGIALVFFLPAIWLVQFLFVLGCRFFFGMFQAGGFPALSRMMADWMPMEERASAQGFIWMSSRLGGLVVPYFFAWLLFWCGDWKGPFWIFALLGIGWCAVFWPWFRNKPEEMNRVNSAERAFIVAGRGVVPAHHHVPWRKMLSSISVWALCLMYGFGGFSANFYVTLLPIYLRDHQQLSPEDTTWVTSAPFGFGMVACAAGGILSDRFIRRTGRRKWGRRLNGLIGLSAGALGWLALDWVHDPWSIAFVVCAIFFCNDLNMGPAWASCADIGRRYAGTIGGAMNMIGNILGVAGNLIAGFFFQRGQTGLLFVIYAASFGLAALCWLFVDVTKPLAESPLDEATILNQKPGNR